jgi:hypothetical protein
MIWNTEDLQHRGCFAAKGYVLYIRAALNVSKSHTGFTIS